MESSLAIKIALANTGHDVNPNEVYNYIESNSKEIEAYQLDSTKVTAAAIDYILLLSAVGSAASIASLLWMAYDKFIAPKKKHNATAGLYIVIHLSDKERIEFWIGNTHIAKDEFIKEFTSKVTTFRNTKEARKEFEATKQQVSRSGNWIKRK